jgi:serine/threonine protein kinase
MESGSKPRVGKYILERVLGRGAMGVVYLAKDPTIGRNVAVKCIYLPQGLEEDKVREFRERFLREARAAGVMNHPNIVTIYEADEGSAVMPPFIAMEFIEGETWNQKIKKGQKFSPDHLFPMLKEISSSLEYAHKANVIHRDIKPGNIIETKDGHAKLMDFGIAKVPTSELTREGQFLGTPAYMSPEQVLGKVVDARSDLFSLGAVAYEMVTGKKPFDGEEVTTVLHKIVSEEAPDIRELEGDVSKEAWAIIKKLLRKNIDERYSNATELISDIEAYLAGALPPYAQDYVEKTVPPKESPVIKKQASSEKKQAKPMLIIGSLIFCAVIGIGVLLYLWFKGRGEENNEQPIPNSSENIDKSGSREETIPPVTTTAGESQEKNPEAAPSGEPQTAPAKTKPNRPPVKKPPVQPAVQPAPPKAENEKVNPVQKVRMLLSFDLGGTKRGDASITIDGKLIKAQKIDKGVLKDNVWIETIEMPAGKHKIKLYLNTKIMGIQTSTEEEHEFTAGPDIQLNVKIQKITTKLIFKWSR